ncbi:MAG: hypothetical protein JW841_03395, partial [Deltaproteobacteria bacterium]|nr:hypothetical protein [Deltaproteobacteria bacterium]
YKGVLQNIRNMGSVAKCDTFFNFFMRLALVKALVKGEAMTFHDQVKVKRVWQMPMNKMDARERK